MAAMLRRTFKVGSSFEIILPEKDAFLRELSRGIEGHGCSSQDGRLMSPA